VDEILEHWQKRCGDEPRGFGEGAGLKNPVTEAKRSQTPKGPLPNGLRLSATALRKML